MNIGPDFHRAYQEILKDLPEGVNFDMTNSSGAKLFFQAHTRAEFRLLREGFPGVVWDKSWDKFLKWWEFDCEYKGWKIHVYAGYENPPTCKAITEKRVVKVKVPTAFEEKEEEQEVIVGWDCGKADEPSEVEA